LSSKDAKAFFETADPDFLVSAMEISHPVRQVIADTAWTESCVSVLDAGCNVGMSYPYFRERTFLYYGIDFQEKFVQRAKELHPSGEFRVGNVLSIPFKDRSMDMVFCKDVLEHLEHPNYKQAVSEMWRCANKVMCVSFFNAPGEQKLSWHDAGFWNNTYDVVEFEMLLANLPGVSSYSVQRITTQTLYTVYRFPRL